MAIKDFTTSHVHGKHLIHTGCVMWGMKTQNIRELIPNNPPQVLEDSEQKGDLLIWDLWNKGTDSIHDMLFVHTESTFYL